MRSIPTLARPVGKISDMGQRGAREYIITVEYYLFGSCSVEGQSRLLDSGPRLTRMVQNILIFREWQVLQRMDSNRSGRCRSTEMLKQVGSIQGFSEREV